MTIVAPPRGDAVAERLLGTRSTLADLEALWAAPPRPSVDDLAVVRTAFPSSRRPGQDQDVQGASWTAAAKWTAGGLLLDGERSGHGTFQGVREGRTFTLGATLGTLDVRCHDQSRRERALRADADRARRDADAFAALVDAKKHCACTRCAENAVRVARQVADTVHGRSITEWTSKSRARMVRAFASIDYSAMDSDDGDGAMVTLTYPGDWLAVAPTGKVVKKHLEAFKVAWQRAMWDGATRRAERRDPTTGLTVSVDVPVYAPIRGLWKLEFQDRGAPHFHLYLKVPVRVAGLPFKTWLSQTWAKIVGASRHSGEYQRHLAAGTNVDFGKASRMTDAKRLAVYFLKHGSKTLDDKEYQHNVPAAWQGDGDGPGRFWGYWGLEKPVVLIDVDERDFYAARRVLRRMTRAHGRHVAYQRARGAALDAGRPAWEATQYGVAARVPDVWTLGSSGSLSGGWVLVNDGVAAGLDLARYLHSLR